MREDYGSLNLVTHDDGFGDMGFDTDNPDIMREAIGNEGGLEQVSTTDSVINELKICFYFAEKSSLILLFSINLIGVICTTVFISMYVLV